MADAKRLNILQRLNAVQQKVGYIQKEPKKQGMQYSFVSHDSVTALVRPHMVEAGVLYYPVNVVHTQVGNRTECALTVRFVAIDDATDFIDVPSLGYGIDAQDKGPGKAISYAVKYALLKTFGLETGDDPDKDQHTGFDTRDPEGEKNNIHVQNVNAFVAGIKEKMTIEDLEGWAGANKGHLEDAAVQFPHVVKDARAAYKAQADRLKATAMNGGNA